MQAETHADFEAGGEPLEKFLVLRVLRQRARDVLVDNSSMSENEVLGKYTQYTHTRETPTQSRTEFSMSTTIFMNAYSALSVNCISSTPSDSASEAAMKEQKR